jgi:N-acyl-D-amino-acid deacylase
MLRSYVMGRRGGDHFERPTPDELEQISMVVEDSLRAGAFGFSTARTVKHFAADGRPTPGKSASWPELAAIADGMRNANRGVIQVHHCGNPCGLIYLVYTVVVLQYQQLI